MQRWMVILLALLLAGCTTGQTTDDGETPQARAGSDRERDYEREDGPVAVSLAPGTVGYRATQTVRLVNDLDALLSLVGTSVNGRVTLETSDTPSYEVMVELAASGSSEQEARDHLATMQVTHADAYQGAGIRVATVVVFEEYTPTPGLPGVSQPVSRSADLTIRVPRTIGDLHLDTTNGQVETGPLTADRVVLDTTNGAVVATGLRAADVTADTTNGRVDVEGTPTKSGQWVLDTTNGDVLLELTTSDAIGYDIHGDTTNGEVVIDVPGTEPVGEQDDDEKHYRTTGFSSRGIRVDVVADTTNGDVHVTG